MTREVTAEARAGAVGARPQVLDLDQGRRSTLLRIISAMPPTPPIDPAREAADLMSLAGWYRAWAELAGSEREKAQRIDFAIGLEKRARAMLKPD